MVNKITTTELRQGKINGGIIFQGCAEPHEDWVNGINEMLTDEGILLEGTKYKPEDVYTFQHEGITNLVFPFEPVKLDIGKLAMWRLATHGTFSAKWVEDYVDNRLGGPLPKSDNELRVKPNCPPFEKDGDIITIDIPSRKIDVDADLESRKKDFNWKFDGSKYPRFLNLFVKNVGSMAHGGIWE